jgi:NADH-quinone oxidoreductase subunit G
MEFLVVSELFLTETAKLADIVLPAQSFVEREGTSTSGERRVQRYYPGVPPMQGTRPDWKIFAQIAELLGLKLPTASSAAVQAHIAQCVPIYAGMTYTNLAKVAQQYPDVGGRDLYYGGTAYRNTGGLGLVWPVLAEDAGRRLAVKAVAGAPFGAPLQAVPVTLLYNAGTLMNMPGPGELGGVVRHDRPPLLASHVPAPYIALHPADAARLSVAEGEPVTVHLGTRDVAVEVRIDDAVPAGVALLPRGLAGVGKLKGPVAIEIGRNPQSGVRSPESKAVTTG